MIAFSPKELKNLTETVTKAVAIVLTADETIGLTTLRILHHALRSHTCTENEARTVWATIFAGALRANADMIEEQLIPQLSIMESKTDQQIASHVQEILDKLNPDKQ